MQIIDDENVALWLNQKGLLMRARKVAFPDGPIYNIALEIPTNPSQSMYLASALTMLEGQATVSGGLFWIGTWGIWTTWSTELGEYIISRLRSQGGPMLPLSGQSGHLFESGDKMLATALLWQTMLLNWDGFYIPNSAEYVIEISNDGLCWAVCRDRSCSVDIEAQLEPWNPQRRDASS